MHWPNSCNSWVAFMPPLGIRGSDTKYISVKSSHPVCPKQKPSPPVTWELHDIHLASPSFNKLLVHTLGIYCWLGTALGSDTEQWTNSLVFSKLTVEGHIFMDFPKSIKLKNLAKILHDPILFSSSNIHERPGHRSKHTHFVIVPQNQWDFIDFTGRVVLKYNFWWKGLEQCLIQVNSWKLQLKK